MYGVKRRIDSIYLTGEEKKADVEEQKRLFERFEPMARATWGDERYVKWFLGRTARLVELDCGRLVDIEKENIDTHFCFGYGYCGGYRESEDATEAAYGCATDGGKYFYAENLKDKFDCKIEPIMDALECPARYHCVSGAPHYCGGSEEHAYFSIFNPAKWDCYGEEVDGPHKYIPLTENDLYNLLRAYLIERGRFEKRLQAYLKKYGTSKLNIWTYWADE
ncbi:MAG: hypothetical protein LUD47_07810 [Clostridia bacterium]|nr:hypothetical protein [Clostridia bacterium]